QLRMEKEHTRVPVDVDLQGRNSRPVYQRCDLQRISVVKRIKREENTIGMTGSLASRPVCVRLTLANFERDTILRDGWELHRRFIEFSDLPYCACLALRANQRR